jgi:hypothetical protein
MSLLKEILTDLFHCNIYRPCEKVLTVFPVAVIQFLKEILTAFFPRSCYELSDRSQKRVL